MACAVSIAAAPSAAQSAAPGEREYSEPVHSGVRDGLPVGPIHSIALSAGEIWAASAQGVAWFDQYHWRAASLGSARGVRGVVASTRDPYAYAWGDAWILRLSPTSSSPLRLGGDLQSRGVVELAVAPNGVLALATDGRVTLLAEGAEPRVVAADVRWLGASADVPVCVAASGWRHWRNGEWREGVPPGPETATALGVDGTRIRADGRRLREWVLAPMGDPTEPGGAVPLRAVHVDGVGRSAAVNGRGDVFVGAEGRWLHRARLRGVAADAHCVLVDGLGRVWVGTAAGVSMLRAAGGSWKSVRAEGAGHGAVRIAHRAGVPPSWVTETDLVIDGVQTDAIELEGRTWPMRGALDVCFDAAGDLWVAPGPQVGGVLRRGAEGWEWLRRRAGDRVPIRGVVRIARDTAGGLWLVSAATFDLMRVDAAGAVRRWEHGGALGGWVSDIADDGARLWFALPDFGIKGFDKLRREWVEHPVSGGARSACWDAPRDRLWFVTDRGSVGWVQNGEVDTPLALAEVGARAIAQEGGRVWILTGDAICSYDGRRLHAHRAPPGLAVRGAWDSRKDHSLIAEDGRVLFPSSSGVGIYASPPTPEQPFRVTWDYRDNGVHWEVQPHVAIDAEVFVRHRFGGGAWSEWEAARGGELALPSDRAEARTLETEVSAGLASTERYAFEVPASPAGGWGWLWIVAGGLALAGGVLAWRLRGSAEELRANRRLYRELVDSAEELICVLDPDGLVRSANPSSHAVLGLVPTDLEGVSFRLLLADRSVDVFLAEFHACLADGSAREFRGLLRRADGVRFAGEIRLSPLRRRGRVRGVRCVVRDLTARERIESMRAQDHKMSALGHMAGGMAHDFNNVLQIIQGYSESLVGQTRGELRALAQEVFDASRQGSALVGELSLFSRRDRPLPEPAELNEMIRAECSNVRQLIGPNVRVALDLSGEPLWVRLSRSDVQRVLLNLAANGRDAMPDGGELRIETAPADEHDLERLRGGRMDEDGLEGAVIVVRDTGPGMDEETRLRVFDPFYTTKPLGRGTGLGLSTVYGVVVAARGVIAVSAESGLGAEFRVVLPRSPRPASSGSQVLVVEDDAGTRRELVALLRDRGYEVIEAEGIGQAVDASRASEHLDLIVADLMIAEGTGPQVVDSVRRWHPDVPALFVTSEDAAQLAERGIEVRDAELLRTPLESDEIGERVNEILSRRQ